MTDQDKERGYSELEALLSAALKSAGAHLTPTEVLGALEMVKAAYLEAVMSKTLGDDRVRGVKF